MNKYAVFSFDQYYPSGGIDDLHSVHDSLEAAAEVASSKDSGLYELRQVVDCSTMSEVGSWHVGWDNRPVGSLNERT